MTFVTSGESSSALVTGAGGFVGSYVCSILAARGWQIVAVSRKAPSGPETRGVIELTLPLLSNSALWQRALTSIHCVIHLAAQVHKFGTAGKSAAAFHLVNVEGSTFVAEQAARAGVRRFVFLSSIKVNGEGGSAYAYRTSDTPNPRDPYAQSKLAAETKLRDICIRAGMELVIIRPPLIYGPGVRANFQRLMSMVALGVPLPFRSIENRRSLVGIWNLVSFIETCMTHPDAAGEPWLISDGEDLSTPELIEKLAGYMHKSARLFSLPPVWLRRIGNVVGLGAEVSRLCDSLQVDATPARDRLQWRPVMSADEGLARTVAAYRIGRPK